jgi:two-component system nitrate/nitrite response regulator NarP
MITVLLADDHPFMRTGIEAVLRGSRYSIVASAATGDEALDAIARTNPKVCILDVRMPGKSGLEGLQAMRANGDRRPVVLLTAELDDAVLIEAMRAGVEGIVLKDGAEDELLSCLDTVTAGGRAIPPALLQHALDLSLNGSSDALAQLSARERQLAELVGRGMRNRDIATALSMSEGTVKVYLHNVYQKLGIENRTELAMLTLGQGPLRAPSNTR